ncbi:MAG: hypothetical protein AseanaTS_00700 [Candidatus Pelagadaptatus aseana]|uniref:hypothetical protein n=1 Tax=Candidatus Pelagadaptatus aseana TaxID=3120508 RepID=UPI0039B25BFB
MYHRIFSHLLLAATALLLNACDDKPPAPDNTDTATITQEPAKKPTILWAKPGFAPLFIHQPPFQGQGTGDLMFDILQQKLPQFRHSQTKANYARIIAEMRKGTEMCALMIYKREREAFAYFSQPIAVNPSYQLYLSTEGKQAIDRAYGYDLKTASFDELLGKSRDLTLLITPNQSYGIERDALIAKHIDHLNIKRNFSDQSATMKMLAANRVQMLLVLPWVFNYEKDVSGLHGKVTKVQLTDVPADDSYTIACTRTEQGKQVVDAIDQIKPAAHTLLKQAAAAWLEPEEMGNYQRAYNKYFPTR